MRRRAVLLLSVMVAAILLASGIALAKTITCQVGITCNGTKKADDITGTPSDDTINGLKGNDFIDGDSGADTINDGAGDDTIFDGPTGNTDNDILQASKAKSLLTPSNLKGGDFLVGDGGDDTFYDLGPGLFAKDPLNAFDTWLEDDGTTNDTYILSRGFGSDVISDAGGSGDVLDLSKYRSSEVAQIFGVTGDGDGLAESVHIVLSDGSSPLILDFYDNTSADPCANGFGVGRIETLKFKDRNVTDPCSISSSSASSAATAQVSDKPEKASLPTKDAINDSRLAKREDKN